MENALGGDGVRETTAVVVIKWVAKCGNLQAATATAPAPVPALLDSLQISHLESFVRVVDKDPVLRNLTALRYGRRCCNGCTLVCVLVPLLKNILTYLQRHIGKLVEVGRIVD